MNLLNLLNPNYHPTERVGGSGHSAWPHSLRELFELVLEPGGHHAEGPVGAREGALPGGVEEVVLAAPSAALRRRRADIRADHALGDEPVERDVDGARRKITAGAGDDLAVDCGAERAVAKTQEREQDQLLELAENRAEGERLHIANIVY